MGAGRSVQKGAWPGVLFLLTRVCNGTGAAVGISRRNLVIWRRGCRERPPDGAVESCSSPSLTHRFVFPTALEVYCKRIRPRHLANCLSSYGFNKELQISVGTKPFDTSITWNKSNATKRKFPGTKRGDIGKTINGKINELRYQLKKDTRPATENSVNSV
ncbi:UNVERIFIED_CONTAM: hypothetical protein FKN15_007374 [Acipenser sinensis]